MMSPSRYDCARFRRDCKSSFFLPVSARAACQRVERNESAWVSASKPGDSLVVLLSGGTIVLGLVTPAVSLPLSDT